MQGQKGSTGSSPDTISFDINPIATDMGMSSSSGTRNYVIRIEQKREERSNNANSMHGLDLDQSSGNLPYCPLFMQSASSHTHPQNVDTGNNCQPMEENMRGYSCKRKAIEGQIGQSSSSGNSSYF